MYKENLDVSELLEFRAYDYPQYRDSLFFHLFKYFIPLGLLLTWGFHFLLKLKEWIYSGNKVIDNNSVVKKKSRPYTPPKKNLHFKSNLDAFEFSKQIFNANLAEKQISIGIIKENLDPNHDEPFFLVELANNPDSVLVLGANHKYHQILSKGNLVYWGYVEDVKNENIPEVRAIGHIIAVLNPEFDPNEKKWTIKKALNN